MRKHLTSRGMKAAIITGAGLLALAGLGTGLYFGVAAIKDKVDGEVAKIGTVTLKDLAEFDSENMTDSERELLTVKNGVITNKSALDSIALNFDVEFDFKRGAIFYSNLDRVVVARNWFVTDLDEAGDTLGGGIQDETGIAAAYAQTGVPALGAHVVTLLEKGVSITDPAIYDLSPFGYESVAKVTYIWGKLTKPLDKIDKDLTFSKADVLKYADMYEASLTSSSVASSAAASSVASA